MNDLDTLGPSSGFLLVRSIRTSSPVHIILTRLSTSFTRKPRPSKFRFVREPNHKRWRWEGTHIFLSSKFQDLGVKDKVLVDRNFIRMVRQRWGFAEAGSRKTAGTASGWAAAHGSEWGGQRNRTPGANAHRRSHRAPLLWAWLPGFSCCSLLWKVGVASMSHSLLHFTYLHSQHHMDAVVRFCT